MDTLHRSEKDQTEKPELHTATLVKFLLSERHDVWMVIVYAMMIGLLSLAAPVGTQAIVNTIAFGTLLQPLVILTGMVFVGLFLSGVLRAIQSHLIEILQQRLFVQYALRMAKVLPIATFDAFRHRFGPEKANRFFDIVNFQKALSSLLLEGVSVVLQTGIGMLILAMYHPILLAFDIGLLGFIIFIVYVLGKGALQTSLSESSAKYQVGAWIQELARHPTAFRSKQGTLFAMFKTQSYLQTYVKHRKAHFKILFRQIVGSLWLQSVASAMLLGIGGMLVIRRQLTLGQLVAAELILNAVLSGVSKFGKHLENYYDLRSSLEKVSSLLSLEEQRSQGESIISQQKGLHVLIQQIALREKEEGALPKTMSLEIKAGESLAILGKTQAELTRISELLWGIQMPNTGSISFDGIPIQEFSLVSLRTQVALLKGNEVFAGTIAENINLGDSTIESSVLREAIEKANLKETVLSLKEGMQTTILPHGAPLSFLDSRKLMVARTLVQKPKLLLLHGSFLSPFEAGAMAWQNVLFSQDHGFTVILLTTDPALCNFCTHVRSLDENDFSSQPMEGNHGTH